MKQPIFDAIGDDFNRYIREYVAEGDRNNCWSYICFCPMVEFATVNGKSCLDWVGRVESLKHDLGTLSKLLNMDCRIGDSMNVRVPPIEGPKYLGKYDRATVEVVNKLYRDDFEYFSYTLLKPSEFPVRAAS